MTEINWPSPYGFTQFCDDIRQEVGGKLTLVGCYQAELRLAVIPGALLKLHLLVHYFEDLADSVKPLELLIFMPGDPDDAPSTRVEIPSREGAMPLAPLESTGEELRNGIMMPIQISPFQVPREGRLKVRMKRGDDIVRLGSLRIGLMPPEQAAELGIQLPAPPTRDTRHSNLG